MAGAESVQNVRDRIIQLAREIEEFSKSDVPPERFFEEFLKRLVGAVGARAGVVWMRNGQNRLDLVCDCGLSQTGYHDNPNADTLNQRLLTNVLSDGRACIVTAADSDTELPTDDILVLAALQREKECVGVVQVFQRADTPMQARAGFLQFVEQMCGYACRYLELRAAGERAPTRTEFSGQFEQFTIQLHRSLNLEEVAVTAANDGRLLTGCDRLSVAIQEGPKTVIKAISGQDSVNQRANLVRAMTAMASKVIAMGEPLVYAGKLDRLPSQIEEPLADYIQESGSRMVQVVPLLRPERLMKPEESEKRPKTDKRRKPIGGLIIEQISESQPKPGLAERVELVADHVTLAVANAETHERLFLMPLWRFLGSCFGWLHGRNLVKALAVVVLIVAVILAMLFVPWDYRVSSEGRLMPVIQRDVFAPEDGEVIEIFVGSGETVRVGTELLLLRDDELDQQLKAASSELNELQKRKAALRAQLDDAQEQANDADKIRLEGQWAEASLQIIGAEEQVDVLSRRVARLTVRSPVNGVVTTFQIDQKLKNRPVSRGESLLEIKDHTGPWRLEVEIEEHRMGHIRQAQQDLDRNDLDVKFVLASRAESNFEGRLQDMATRTNASGSKDSSIVQAFVSVNVEELPERRIGAEVRAKINCGKKSLGYVLFGDVIEFVRKYFWL